MDGRTTRALGGIQGEGQDKATLQMNPLTPAMQNRGIHGGPLQAADDWGPRTTPRMRQWMPRRGM